MELFKFQQMRRYATATLQNELCSILAWSSDAPVTKELRMSMHGA